MGLHTWTDAPDGKIQKFDVVMAKTYLTGHELAQLSRLVNAYLDVGDMLITVAESWRYAATKSTASRSRARHRRRSGLGTESHSLNTFFAGANGCPLP